MKAQFFLIVMQSCLWPMGIQGDYYKVETKKKSYQYVKYPRSQSDRATSVLMQIYVNS